MIRAFRAHCQFRTSLAALDWLYVGADNRLYHFSF